MKKTFVPRRLAHGGVCCSEAYALCDGCKAFFASENLRSLSEDFTPPNPYDAPLKAIQDAIARTKPQPQPIPAPVGYAPPDPYREALEQLRRDEKR